MTASPNRILVTGGSGFIGNAVVRALLHDGVAEVMNLDVLSYASVPEALDEFSSGAAYRFVQGDVQDRSVCDRVVREFKPEAVVHLAAETHVDRSIDAPRAFLGSNVIGTFTLLESLTAYWSRLPDSGQESFRMVHVSTDEVFGSLDEGDPPFGLHTPYAPKSPYSASKAAADHFVRAWYATYGLPTIITNCSNNFGPWQFPEKFIPVVIMRAMNREQVPIYGHGRQVRDWLYVGDHANGLKTVLERGRPGKTYLFGARNELENRELATSICDILDELIADGGHPRRELLLTVPDRPGHDARYGIDPSTAEQDLGWQPQWEFLPALRQTVRWYLDNRAWVAERLRRTGGYKRLGLGVHG